jgi:pSer/pThr/pTyr-binding forkhead associated (FHA) protein
MTVPLPPPTGALSLLELAHRHRDDTLQVFARKVTYPVLVGAALNAGQDGELGLSVRTVIDEPGAPRRPIDTLVVYEVKKRAGSNPFMNMITLGRASNNDIVLATGNVSKLHAYLRLQDGKWSICDAGSTNGTWLDGRAVDRNGGAVTSHAVVRLGKRIEMEFLLPADLFAILDGLPPARPA